MVALSVQTVLLMAAAYFLGAALACVLRRSLSRDVQPAAVGERRVDPLPEVVQREAEASRFSRAAAQPAPVPQPSPPPPAAKPAPRPAAATKPAPPPAAAKPAPPPAAAPKPAPAPVDTTPQELERIRLIDAGVAAALNKLGINRYEQIAGWMRADVQRVDQALGEKGRVNRENWIEQAQVLAKGGETHYSARRARGEGPSSAPTPDEGERGPPIPAATLPRAMSRAGVAAVVVVPPPVVETKPPPAATKPSRAPAAKPSPAPATKPSPAPATTLPAAAVHVPPPSPPQVAERAAFADRPAVPPATQPAQATAPQHAAPDLAAVAVPVRPAASPTRDNLQRISAISAEIEQALAAQGVSRYSQIAQWSPADVERFDKLLQTGGRIARENWVEQAQILSRGGDTRFSREFDHRSATGDMPAPRPIKLPDAIREQQAAKVDEVVRMDLDSLRSVRSEAYRNAPEPGPDAVQRAIARDKRVHVSAPDDLKRIRGIGVLIEKRLGSLGVSTYEQIANWTAEDIARVSQSLDFKGRIERENWVEQARILASGGTTEFARRVDRGEVETSRARP